MSDDLLQLLTAYVDGELSSSQRKAVARLLEESAEARDLLRLLHRDRDAIRALPRLHLDDGFAPRIISQLGPRTLKPAKASRLVAWLPAAAAAAIIIGIGLGTAALVQDLLRPNRPADNLAAKTPQPEKVIAAENGTSKTSDTPARTAPTTQDLAQFLDGWKNLVRPLGDGVRQVMPDRGPDLALLPSLPESQPRPEVPFSSPAVLTAPPMAAASAFKTIDVKLAMFLDPKNIDAGKLAERLKQDPVHHIDLACFDSWKTFERLQAACRTAGVRLVIDSELSQRLSKKQPTACMVYLENTTPDVVLRLMQALKDEEVKAEARRKGDSQIDSIMVQPLDVAGRKRLAESLGLAPSSLTPMPASPSKTPPSPGLDPTKPLSDSTVKALEKLASKGKEPTAIALVYYPNRTRIPPSKELKQFQDSRVSLDAGAVHVVFFLRPSRG